MRWRPLLIYRASKSVTPRQSQSFLEILRRHALDTEEGEVVKIECYPCQEWFQDRFQLRE